jgi:hypothetical protein
VRTLTSHNPKDFHGLYRIGLSFYPELACSEYSLIKAAGPRQVIEISTDLGFQTVVHRRSMPLIIFFISKILEVQNTKVRVKLYSCFVDFVVCETQTSNRSRLVLAPETRLSFCIGSNKSRIVLAPETRLSFCIGSNKSRVVLAPETRLSFCIGSNKSRLVLASETRLIVFA